MTGTRYGVGLIRFILPAVGPDAWNCVTCNSSPLSSFKSAVHCFCKCFLCLSPPLLLPGPPNTPPVSSAGTAAPWALFTSFTPVSFGSSDAVTALVLSRREAFLVPSIPVLLAPVRRGAFPTGVHSSLRPGSSVRPSLTVSASSPISPPCSSFLSGLLQGRPVFFFTFLKTFQRVYVKSLSSRA